MHLILDFHVLSAMRSAPPSQKVKDFTKKYDSQNKNATKRNYTPRHKVPKNSLPCWQDTEDRDNWSIIVTL